MLSDAAKGHECVEKVCLLGWFCTQAPPLTSTPHVWRLEMNLLRCRRHLSIAYPGHLNLA